MDNNIIISYASGSGEYTSAGYSSPDVDCSLQNRHDVNIIFVIFIYIRIRLNNVS